jgi:hypothetical protein
MSARALRSMCRDTVSIKPWLSENEYRVPQYGDATTYPARVEVRSTLIAGSAGQTQTARGRVYLYGSAVIGTKDELTLPAWCEPTQPPILSVEPKRDGQTEYSVVYYG